MEKLNIAELLKDCPKGMELDCINYDGIVTLEEVLDNYSYPIRINIKYNNEDFIQSLTEYGQTCQTSYNKCIIFPKGKTTWEGFQRPFKDGYVITCTNCLCSFVAIFKEILTDTTFNRYASLTLDDEPQFKAKGGWADFLKPRFATKEEKQKLFDAIKANGYKWNPETKTLEKLIIPKFKVGDRIRHKRETRLVCVIARVEDRYYVDGHPTCYTLLFSSQDEYELVPNKFDITTLKPFDKVLVRDNNEQKWTIDMFSFYDKTLIYPFICIGHYVNQCIPYEGNEHLLGTTNDCDEYFKTWK